MNPEQQRAVDYGDGPLMVLAGAGTGKTRVLVHRIAAMVKRGIAPREILAVTFTNKAAQEMRERLKQAVGWQAATQMWIGTFHATCARMLRSEGHRVGLSREFSIFDGDDQQRLLSRLLKEHGLDDAITPRTVGSMIDRAKNRGEDPVSFHQDKYGDDVLATIYPKYKAQLEREDAVDFNDLLLRVLELADDPDFGVEFAKFRYVLVDEFQDTNLVQYRLVRHLSKGTHNLTVVGDDDQSIYSWRGAEPRNLLDFDRDFPKAEIIKLERNYRSTQVILDAANSIIKRNRDRRGKALWTERDGGEPVLWEECADERMEADFVARAVAGLCNDEGREWGDMAVLYRTHAQSRVLEEQLRRHSIDYRIVGGVSFFQRREIKDTLAYLRLVSNPAADSCFERIVNVPSRGIGKTTVDRVRAHARIAGISVLDAARSCSHGAVPAVKTAARKKLGGFIAVLDGLRDVQSSGASVAELIIQAVERSGYRERLEVQDSPEARDRLANLAELVNMASDFDDEMDGKGTLVQFDERISLSSANDEADGRGSAVTMMTIHAAKGLEFPVVFLCGLEEGLFPSLREREGSNADRDLEEERRLAYVALTRGMDRLVLTNARVRRQWGEAKMNRPSRFLDDIPMELMAIRSRPEPTQEPENRLRRRAPLSAGRGAQAARDPMDQSSDFDEMPEWSPEAEVGVELVRGSAVKHASFGQGRVLEARGEGAGQKLLIDFPGAGLKTILARFVEPIA